jgi:hypothetical protein
MSFLDDVNEFFIEHSGVTAQAIDKLIKDRKEIGSVFFQPYTSAGNFFQRTAYVASAPIFLGILSAELMIASLILAVDAVFSFITIDTEAAKNKGENLLLCSLLTIGAALSALASPFINAVDLVGSLFASQHVTIGEHEAEPHSEYAPS